MISLRAGFLFLHIPKCAGNSIQNVLVPWSDDRIVRTRPDHDGIHSFEVANPALATRKHSTLAEYRQKLPAATFRSLYKFTCVRNPWDRMLSHFFFKRAKRGRTDFNRRAFARFIRRRRPVEYYVSTSPHGTLFSRGDGSSEFGETLFAEIDHYLRFEHLNEDFEVVRKELDIPFDPIPERNRGKHRHYADYYDATTQELVDRRFAAEIDYFGYRFEER